MTEFGNKWLIDEAKKQYPGYDYYIPVMDDGRYVIMANKWNDIEGDCTPGNVGVKVDAMSIYEKSMSSVSSNFL